MGVGTSIVSENSRPSAVGTAGVMLPQTARDRAKSAIIGAFVADAASMPLHLIYDQAAVERLIFQRQRANPDGIANGAEFLDPPASPFYSYAVGRQSPYGDEVIPLLQSLVSRGFFDREHASEEMFQNYRNYQGRSTTASALFVEQRELGADWPQCASPDDMSFQGLAKVPVLVARYAGSAKLLGVVEEAVRIQQTNPRVLAACRLAARLLERVVLGSSVLEALQWARDCDQLTSEEREHLYAAQELASASGPSQLLQLHVMSSFGQSSSPTVSPPSSSSASPGDGDAGKDRDRDSDGTTDKERERITTLQKASSLGVSHLSASACGRRGVPFSLAADNLGLSAQLPGCLRTSLYALYCFRGYEQGVRANIVAAGDNALRGWLVGSLLAAELGEAAIPQDWCEKTDRYSEVAAMANRLVGSNPHFDSLKEKNCRFPDF